LSLETAKQTQLLYDLITPHIYWPYTFYTTT